MSNVRVYRVNSARGGGASEPIKFPANTWDRANTPVSVISMGGSRFGAETVILVVDLISGAKPDNSSGALSVSAINAKPIGAFLSIIPLVIAFLCLQRFWRAGLTAGAIK